MTTVESGPPASEGCLTSAARLDPVAGDTTGHWVLALLQFLQFNPWHWLNRLNIQETPPCHLHSPDVIYSGQPSTVDITARIYNGYGQPSTLSQWTAITASLAAIYSLFSASVYSLPPISPRVSICLTQGLHMSYPGSPTWRTVMLAGTSPRPAPLVT